MKYLKLKMQLRIQIPGSHNSKCIEKNQGTKSVSGEVRIIHQWDGVRPKIRMLDDFYVYLADQKIKELQEMQRWKVKKQQSINSKIDTITWIERLLQTPIEDDRKFVVWRILAPYLLNVRKLSYDEAFNIIKDWLSRCDKLRRLDFNTNLKIKEGIKGAQKGYFPISFEDLKVANPKLYSILEK